MKLKSLLTTSVIVVTAFMSTMASAVPTLGQILAPSAYANPAHNAISADNAQSFALTDTSGVSDDATAFLLMEFAAFHGSTSFGIYDFTVDMMGNVTVGSTLEIFAGSDGGPGSTFDTTTIAFDLVTGVAENVLTGATAMIDDTFGFYLNVPAASGAPTWYSHTSLNSDGIDHVYSYETAGTISEALLFGSNVVLAWEDLPGGGDMDYRDFVVGISDIRPVPVPATLALIGLGLLGFALRRRKAMQI